MDILEPNLAGVGKIYKLTKFDLSSPKLLKTWDFDLEHIDDVGNALLLKFKMADAGILNFEKRLPFFLLFDQSSPNLVGILLL